MIDEIKRVQKKAFVALNLPGWPRKTTKKLI
jgi:hypothetical protein